MNKITIILTVQLYILTSISNAQTFGYNIVEVFWDKDTVETFDYTFEVISNNDTIRPKIEENYFFKSIELTGQVSIIFKIKGRKVIVSNVDSYFLSGHSYTKLIVNPNAADTSASLDLLILRCYLKLFL